MADNNKIVDLVELIKNNFSAIQKGTYEWQKEDIDALYKLAHSVVYELNLPFGNEREDVVADIVTDFFADTLRNINIEREEGLSSYIYTTFKWNVLNYYNRKFKDYHQKIVLSLDTPIINQDENRETNKNKLDAIEYYEKPIDERIDFNFIKQYYDEALEFVRQYPLLNSYYIDKKSPQELSEEYDVSLRTIYYRIQWLTEAMKLVLMEKGYTSDNIKLENIHSDVYQYTERRIQKVGLLYLIYNQGNDVKDVSDALNIDVNSIHQAIKHLLEKKVNLLSDKGVLKAEKYVDFTQFYFPNFLYKIEDMSEEYKLFVDELLRQNKMLAMRFEKNLTYKEIGKKFNVKDVEIGSKMMLTKNIVKDLYDEYVNNECDLTVVDINKKRVCRK